jgi:hypothetical protein
MPQQLRHASPQGEAVTREVVVLTQAAVTLLGVLISVAAILWERRESRKLAAEMRSLYERQMSLVGYTPPKEKP